MLRLPALLPPPQRMRQLGQGAKGLDNLLYSADADFSCFADLALTSPVDYYREGSGSLMQASSAGPAAPACTAGCCWCLVRFGGTAAARL